MAIRLRRGNKADFDASKMLSGEFAIALDENYVAVAKSPNNMVQLATIDDLGDSESRCEGYVEDCEGIKEECEDFMNNATYTYVMYSKNPNGSEMVEIPNDSTQYMGVYTGSSKTAPTDYRLYKWSDIKGKTGNLQFATFNVVKGNLIMTTNDEPSNWTFEVKNGELYVNVG